MRLIRTDAALLALRPAWQALWARVPGASPFQSPAWLLPWWQAFGTGQPVVAVLEQPGGTLDAILPLYILQQNQRKLLPIGVGISDYFDALAIGGIDLAPLLAAALAEAGDAQPTLAGLAPDAALLATALPPGWDETRAHADPCPVLTLPAAIPAGMARNLRQSRHRADRAGGWTAGTADPATGWAALLSLHRARWTRLGHIDGVLGDPAVLAFHDAAVPELAAAGLLRFTTLHIAGRLAALYYILAAHGRLLFYLSAFDEAFARESPGTLLMGATVEQAAADGFTELDFLRGAEPYKYAWGAIDRWNTTRFLSRACPRAAAAAS